MGDEQKHWFLAAEGMAGGLCVKPKAVGTPQMDICASGLIMYDALGRRAGSGAHSKGLGFYHVPPFSVWLAHDMCKIAGWKTGFVIVWTVENKYGGKATK